MPKSLKLTCLECESVNRVPEDKLGAGPKCGTCGARLNDGKVRAVDLKTLQKAARNDDVPLVVDFWAPWCGPCRMMAPEFAKAAQAMAPTVRFAKIDTQEHPNAGAKFNIRGIPALIRFAGGREAKRLAGARPAADIVTFARG